MNCGNGIVEDGEITEDGWHSVWYIKTHTSRHIKNICAVLNILLIVTDVSKRAPLSSRFWHGLPHGTAGKLENPESGIRNPESGIRNLNY